MLTSKQIQNHKKINAVYKPSKGTVSDQNYEIFIIIFMNIVKNIIHKNKSVVHLKNPHIPSLTK